MTTKWIVAAGATAALTFGLGTGIAAAQSDDVSPTPPTTSILRDGGHQHMHDQMKGGQMVTGDMKAGDMMTDQMMGDDTMGGHDRMHDQMIGGDMTDGDMMTGQMMGDDTMGGHDRMHDQMIGGDTPRTSPSVPAGPPED